MKLESFSPTRAEGIGGLEKFESEMKNFWDQNDSIGLDGLNGIQEAIYNIAEKVGGIKSSNTYNSGWDDASGFVFFDQEGQVQIECEYEVLGKGKFRLKLPSNHSKEEFNKTLFEKILN